MKLHHERAGKMQLRAAGPRVKQVEKQLLIEHINLAKVAAGNGPETRRLIRGVKFLLEAFPPEERVPVGNEQDVTIGGSPHNRWCFTLARKGDELVGASSVLYLDDAATVLIGYVRATAGLGGSGMKILGARMLEFGQAAASETGKTLQSICGEVERPDVMNTIEAKARLRLLRSLGAGLLGPGTSFKYYQPQENGSLLPLAIAVYPLQKQTQMRADEVKTLVRAIYASIYDHLPKKVYDAALAKILGSIPKEPLQIVR